MDDKDEQKLRNNNDEKMPDDGQGSSTTHEAHEIEEEDRREFDLVRQHDERFDPKRWEQASEFKRQMPRITIRTQDPGPAILGKLKENEVGIFLGKDDYRAAVRPAKNPNEKGSFGFVGTFAMVEAKSFFIDGILVLRVNPKKLGLVICESLRLFRWDEDAKRFHKIPDSGVSSTGDYVFGRITQPGHYAVIGVNAHPLVLHTVKVLCNLRQSV